MTEQARQAKREKAESIQAVVQSIQYFMEMCAGYQSAPPSQNVLIAFQGVQKGFENLSADQVSRFIYNLQEVIGIEQADGFMNRKFGSDILAFYFDPNEQTRKSMNGNFEVLLKALSALQSSAIPAGHFSRVSKIFLS